MRFLGFITGIALIGWIGIGYIQEKEPAAWRQLTEEAQQKWRELLARYTTASPNPGENPAPAELSGKSSETRPATPPPEAAMADPPPSSQAGAKPEPQPQITTPALPSLSAPRGESSEGGSAILPPEAAAMADPPPSSQAEAKPEPQLEMATPALPRLAESLAPDEPSAKVEEAESRRSWQVFWKPFSNPLSAHGFAQRVGEITGLDIEVTRASANKYLIQFPYTTEEERQYRIELIEERTALKLNVGK